MGLALYEHNRIAYESAVSMLAETGKAAVIHPTGTGKSFIGFRLCEEHADKIICWLSPSEYIYGTQTENWRRAGGASFSNIKFCTYSRLMLMSDGDLAKITPDYIVLDEFHRAGAEMWGKGVARLLGMYADVPVLGLSATNIRYLDNQRNMADELFDGNVASEITLGEAIARGILTAPTYVISQYSCVKDLKRFEERARRAKNRAVRDSARKYIEAIRRSLDKADGLDRVFQRHIVNKAGKYIAFCSDKAHLDEMLLRVPEWFGGIDDHPHIYKTYSEDLSSGKAFADFKRDDSSHLKLLFCIDMLNEGVHISDVDGVILFRPTVSPIIYKQQIGRALSAGKSGQSVIIDVVNNFENLYAIGWLEDEIRVAVSYYRSLGLDDEIVNERFRVIDETRDSRKLFDALNETLSASWNLMYGYASAYYREHGNLETERRYRTPDGYALGNWIYTQRAVRAGRQFGNLTRERIAKLDEIGMVWDSRFDSNWRKYFAEAKRYRAEHGDLEPAANYVAQSGVRLGAWLSNLRTYRKSGIRSRYLTEERVKDLESLGMVWDVPDYYWERNFKVAQKYYEEHGDLDVKADCVAEGVKLGAWIRNLRAGRARSEGGSGLTDERIKRLDAIGMRWEDKFALAWEKGYAQACAYRAAHGNLNVPAAYVGENGYRLGAWIGHQREKYKAKNLQEERVEKLNRIGMIWRAESSWEERYALAEKFYGENGHLNVPARFVADGVWLNKWLNEQKHIYYGRRKGKNLTREQIARLEAIGMRWSDGETARQNRRSEVRQRFDRYGSLAKYLSAQALSRP